MTPLHTAACQGESDIARQLILKGASVFERDEEMSTPLHETATVGDTKTAKIIFDACKGDVSQIVRVEFSTCIIPFPNSDTFLHPWETRLLKTLWEKEKLVVMSKFSFFPQCFLTVWITLFHFREI